MDRRIIGIVAALALCSACSGKLTRGTALDAWNERMAQHPCTNVAFSDARVTGITQSEDAAQAELTVTGRYTGPAARPYELPDLGDAWFGPCAGFNALNPGERSVPVRLYFRKYDSGWRIAGME